MRHSWLVVLLLWWVPLFAVTPIPAITDPVMDSAGILSQNAEAYLDQQLRDLHQAGGSQIAILTVPRLEDETIEQLGIRVAEQWKLGTAEKDNGVILVIAAQDRKLRIEVGQGLEGVLTDVYASRITREKMTPLFRDGDFDAGVIAGIAHIVAYTDPDFKFGVDAPEPRVRRNHVSHRTVPFGMGPLLFLGIIALLFLVFHRGGPRGPFGGFGGGGFGGGGFGGGGFGGGGGGGGGFGGGGGGFSGGGASDSW